MCCCFLLRAMMQICLISTLRAGQEETHELGLLVQRIPTAGGWIAAAVTPLLQSFGAAQAPAACPNGLKTF